MQNSRARWSKVSPLLYLQESEILRKGMPDCRLAFSQGIHLIHFNSKAECARWKADLDQDNSPRLTRKNKKWRGDNFTHISSLVKSVMHPISRIRSESHVAVIRLKELPVGFRVISADAVSFEDFEILTAIQKQRFAEIVLTNNSNYPKEVICNVLCVVEAINANRNYHLHNAFGFGDYSDLADINSAASSLNRLDLIKKLNKEL
jgi:hypothetical protein